MSSGRHSTDAQIIGALYPGPWTPLTLTGALTTAAGCYTPSARQWLNMVQLCGTVSGTVANGTTIATLPAALRPASTVNLNIGLGGAASLLQIGVGGLMTVSSSGSGSILLLDGLRFRLV